MLPSCTFCSSNIDYILHLLPDRILPHNFPELSWFLNFMLFQNFRASLHHSKASIYFPRPLEAFNIQKCFPGTSCLVLKLSTSWIRSKPSESSTEPFQTSLPSGNNLPCIFPNFFRASNNWTTIEGRRSDELKPLSRNILFSKPFQVLYFWVR